MTILVPQLDQHAAAIPQDPAAIQKMEHAASTGFPVIFTPQQHDAFEKTPADGK